MYLLLFIYVLYVKSDSCKSETFPTLFASQKPASKCKRELQEYVIEYIYIYTYIYLLIH